MTAYRAYTTRITWLAGWSVVAVSIAAWPGHVSPARAETQTTKPAEVDKTVIEPPRQPSAVEILQELMKEERKRHVIMPSRPGKPDEERPQIVESQPAVSPSADDRPLHPDGDMIADRVGRLVRRA